MPAVIESLQEFIDSDAENRKVFISDGLDAGALGLVTGTQAEIGSLVTDGYTNEEIAFLTQSSPQTIKTHVRNIFRRIGVGRRHEFIYFFRPLRDWSVFPPRDVVDTLTNEEQQFLDEVAEGYTDAEIATIMGWKKPRCTSILNHVRRETKLIHRNEIALWWLSAVWNKGLKPLKSMTYEQAVLRYGGQAILGEHTKTNFSVSYRRDQLPVLL